MTIRAMDMQVLIPRSTDVGKQQYNVNQQGNIHQQEAAVQMQKAIEIRQHQVQNIAQSHGGKVDRDQTKQHNNKKGAGKQLQQTTLSHNEPDESIDNELRINLVLGNNIDIKT